MFKMTLSRSERAFLLGLMYGRSRTASYRGGLTGEANDHHWGGILDDWGGNCFSS